MACDVTIPSHCRGVTGFTVCVWHTRFLLGEKLVGAFHTKTSQQQGGCAPRRAMAVSNTSIAPHSVPITYLGSHRAFANQGTSTQPGNQY